MSVPDLARHLRAAEACSVNVLVAIAALAFAQWYADGSGVSVEWLFDHGRLPFRCFCGEDGCEGFCMMPRDVAPDYVNRGQAVDVLGWLG